jgi:hypothetical protein
MFRYSLIIIISTVFFSCNEVANSIEKKADSAFDKAVVDAIKELEKKQTEFNHSIQSLFSSNALDSNRQKKVRHLDLEIIEADKFLKNLSLTIEGVTGEKMEASHKLLSLLKEKDLGDSLNNLVRHGFLAAIDCSNDSAFKARIQQRIITLLDEPNGSPSALRQITFINTVPGSILAITGIRIELYDTGVQCLKP